jgi:hypothetical protein
MLNLVVRKVTARQTGIFEPHVDDVAKHHATKLVAAESRPNELL